MEPVVSIARLGFRKWYESQLIYGHLALVTCVICMVAVAICLDQLTVPAPLPTSALLFGVVSAAVIVGWKSWCYYHRVLTEAWRFGESAVCRKCETYGRFTVLTSGKTTPPATARDPNPESDAWMNVACKKCGNTWRMPQ